MANINQRLNGLTPLSYLGDNAVQPPDFITKNRPPNATDSKNVYLGTIWLNTAGYPTVVPTISSFWILAALIGNQATWVQMSGGTVLSVNAGNNISITGTAVNPIINVAGTTNHSVQVGNALGALTSIANGVTGQVLTAQTGADPIWAAVPPSGATSFPTDSGIATPNAGVLNIITDNAIVNAGSSVLFSAPGALNTVQLNVSDADENTLIGKDCGNLTLTGGNNVGLGTDVLSSLTTGSRNQVIGVNSGNLITSGSDNTILGDNAGLALITGNFNILLGSNAGSNLTGAESGNFLVSHDGITGVSNLIVVNNEHPGLDDWVINNYPGTPGSGNGTNLFLGQGCGNFTLTVATADNNFALGESCLRSLTTGHSNCMMGTGSGNIITSGSQNVGLGHSTLFNAGAGSGITTGSYNIAIGYTAATDLNTTDSSNIMINNIGIVGDNNTMRIGATTGTGTQQLNKTFIHGIRGITTGINDAVAVLIDSAGQLGTTSSSRRVKENIHDMGGYSECLYRLRPVTFNYINRSSESVSVGLIAEEVYETAPQLVAHSSDGEIETVKYQDLVPMLLNEVQKLKARIDILEKEKLN